MDITVTTSRRPSARDIHRATQYARGLHALYIARGGHSFTDILQLASAQTGKPIGGVLVVRWPELLIWTPTGVLQYHPGMALHRVAGLRRGAPDTMVDAMELKKGDHVLDCTAGLASDSVVASYAVGPEGQVVSLESVAPIALLLKVGLARYPGQGPELTGAMRRVRVRHANYLDALQSYPGGKFDVVYFDPMFTEPVHESTGIAPLRPLANYTSLTTEGLELAARVARRYVVVKERRDGPLVHMLKWDDIRGGRKSRVIYLVRQAN